MAEKKEVKTVKEKKEKAPAKVKAEKPAKTPRAKKAPKTVEADNLPKIFRKDYPAKKFEKKILKKISIDSDQKLVKSLYEKKTDDTGREIYTVDLTKPVEQKNVQRLKIVAKQIKKQKGAVKLVPLLATLIFLVVVGITVTTFKNIIVKRVIISSMQSVFLAETNVSKVDVQFIKSSLEIKGIQQTNKDNPKFNIFAVDDIKLDFNLNDLLRGKFHVEKIGVEGVSVGSERKKEGRLINKAKNKETKKTEKKIDLQKSELAKGAKEKLTNMFAAYNPETMIKDIEKDLKSPAMAKNITGDVQKAVNKWQETPAKVEKEISDFQNSVQKLLGTDWSSVSDPVALKEALETVNDAVTKSKSISDSVSGTTQSVKADADMVAGYSKEIQNAIASDKKLIEDKVAEVTHLFSKAGIQEVMTDAVQSMLYDMTGKYYPYISKVMDLAGKSVSKSSSKEKTEKKAKKGSGKRLAGTNIYYRKEKVPKLLIEEVVASGYEPGTSNLLFKGNASNITSDQDVIGKNTTVDASFKLYGYSNSANAVIDSRTDTKEPFVLANYNGAGFPVSAEAEVFNLKSTSDVTAIITAEKTGAFDVGGILDMKVSEMTGMDFEPAAVCSIYKKSLAGIKNLSLGFGIGMDSDGNLNVEIKNMDKLTKQLVDPIAGALNQELSGIAASAKNDAIKALSENTGLATEQISQFTNILNGLDSSQNKINDLQKQIEAKKKEIVDAQTGKLKDQASSAVKDAAKNAGVDTDKAKDALKGLKGLKF